MVHAVIAGPRPGTTVIDLTHHIPPFDVRAGSHTLVRAVPHLGPGVVLGVVDPGVGTARRGICLEVPLADGGTLYFVGPDNGLLVAAAEAAARRPSPASSSCAREQPRRRPTAARPSTAATCSHRSRPRCAPAHRSATLGEAIDPASLVRLIGGVVEQGRLHDGRTCLRAEVTWVDHFGNLQLAATVADARVAGIPLAGSVELAAPDRVGQRVPRRAAAFARPRRRRAALRRRLRGPEARASSACWSTPTGTWPWWPARPRRRSWLNVTAGELLVLAW